MTRQLIAICCSLSLIACGGGEGKNVLVPPSQTDEASQPDIVADIAPPDASPDLFVPVDIPVVQEVIPEVVAPDLGPDLSTDLVEVDAPAPPCQSDDECDDGQLCTTDSCVAGDCQHDAPPGLCCAGDQDCSDGVSCTDDKCVAGMCKHYQDDNLCCANDAMCTDDNACTLDRCVAETCSHTFVNGYGCTCGNYLDCDDGLGCTQDSCIDGQCIYEAVDNLAGCCNSDNQCADTDPVTTDLCVQHTCSNLPASKCETPLHCDDGNPCTTDSCEASGYCSHQALPGCCLTSGECDDQTTLTIDICAANNTCAYSLTDPPTECGGANDCPSAGVCIESACVGGICSASAQPAGGCCIQSSTCNDDDICTADTCQNFQCQYSPVSGFVPHQEWNFDADNMDGFTVEGGGFGVTWQLASDKAISVPHSLYFGNPNGPNGPTLNNGKAVAGKVATPAVTLPDITPHLLRVWAFIDCETLFSRDVVTIYVRHNGVDTPVWSKEDIGGTTGLSWKELEVDLTALNLSGKSIQLVFGFDSIDAVNNDYQGIYFDDIRLLWPCTPQN